MCTRAQSLQIMVFTITCIAAVGARADNLQCDSKAAIDTSRNSGSDRSFTPGFTPYIGELMLVGTDVPTKSNYRIVPMNGTALMPFVYRDTKKLGPYDSASEFVKYPGPNFRFRFDRCDPTTGKWIPVIWHDEFVRQIAVGAYDVYENEMSAQAIGDKSARDPQLFEGTYDIEWIEPIIEIDVGIQHSCHGFIFEVATNYASATTFIQGHRGDGPYPVQSLGVMLKYGGNLVIGTHDNPNYPDTGNPDAPGKADSISAFPYGSPINKTVTNASFVEVSDQERSLGVGVDVCSGFMAIGVMRTFDGRTATAGGHSN